jgi:uncharacterized membrane protein YbaN (DUF454 family)
MVKSKILRFLLIILGFISLGLGFVGILLPVIPTAPFLLLTSFCFVRSSEKINKWLLNSKIYKKHLETFAKNKVMTVKGELILLICVSMMLLTSMYFIDKLVMTIVFTCLILFKCLYFVCNVRPVSKEEYNQIRNGYNQEVELC